MERLRTRASFLAQRLLHWDAGALAWLVRRARPGVTQVMRGFTRLGDTSSWALAGSVLLASGGAATAYGVRLSVAALLGGGAAQLLKRVCRRPRPHLGRYGLKALVEHPDAFSFPSGHTATAFSVAVALAGQGQGLGIVGAVCAGCIAASRVYLGAHYPLDVAAGLLLGVAAGAVTVLALG